MNTEVILTVASVVCTIIAAIFSYYIYIKKKIQQEALGAINKAEDTDKIGKEKLADAVKTVYDLLPACVRVFVPESTVAAIIQSVFDKVEEYARKQVGKEQRHE